ncbi:3-keto-steroid reductase [Myotisia sp. PD_48]|nr:3-keto-steroid reductase [Myotisia sp. PD_48]
MEHTPNSASWKDESDCYILVTGTNSGLGLSLCYRLIDDFLRSRTSAQTLTLIFTTRTEKKSRDTLALLKSYTQTAISKQTTDPIANEENRITLKPEHVDLCDLLSVRSLARRLTSSIPKLDVLVLNAGILGVTGLNWFRAVFTIFTDTIHGLTWPSSYCKSETGVLNAKQTSQSDEPQLGKVFCANVFGHYLLTHYLLDILNKSAPFPGRVIWTSSIEATNEVFDASDIQGLKTPRAYESCKYLTDILALTSSSPSSALWVNQYLGTSRLQGIDTNGSQDKHQVAKITRPRVYVAHPGVCATSIMPLILPLYYAMIGVAFIARLLGSPWHVLSSYNGAIAASWLSLSPQSILDDAERRYEKLGGSKVKWGSSCDRLGRVEVVCTEVEGWGFGGVVGGPSFENDIRRRRKRGAKDLSAEQKIEFQDLARKCWQQMEALRLEWDERLSRAERNGVLKDLG